MILDLEKAIELYEVLEEFLPAIDLESFDLLEFIDEMIDNMESANKQRVYLEAVSLMTGYPIKGLLENHEPKDVLKYFIDGLIENKIVDLVDAMEKLGYGRR